MKISWKFTAIRFFPGYEMVNLSFCRNDCDKRVCSNLAGDFCITDGLGNIRVNSLCDIERLKCKTGRGKLINITRYLCGNVSLRIFFLPFFRLSNGTAYAL